MDNDIYLQGILLSPNHILIISVILLKMQVLSITHLCQVDEIHANYSSTTISLADICMKPLDQDCATQSVLQVEFFLVISFDERLGTILNFIFHGVYTTEHAYNMHFWYFLVMWLY